jgi:hypothetical protein
MCLLSLYVFIKFINKKLKNKEGSKGNYVPFKIELFFFKNNISIIFILFIKLNQIKLLQLRYY